MTAREKKLLALVGAIVLLWGVNLLYGKYTSWYDNATSARDSAAQDLGRAELALHRAKAAQRKLREWQDRSLPSNIQRAESQYRDWLVGQLKAAELSYDYVKPTGGAFRGARKETEHTPLSFSIQAEGDMDEVIRFLDSFYRSDQLHKITKLLLTPKRTGGGGVSAVIDVEALAVQGVRRDEGLAEGVSERLAQASGKEYVERITSRDLFAEYRPPRPEPVVRETPRPRQRSTPPPFDDSERAKWNGVVQGRQDGELQAWINVWTTGEKLHLSAGDKFEIGELKGEVVSVSNKEFVFDTNEGTFSVKLGDSLREGTKVSTSRTGTGG